MPYDEFKKRIDTARNILVGAVPSPAGQIDQITYALMYKFMNDIDDQSAALPGGKRTYFTGDYEKYNWHNLMSPSLGAHERLELYRQAVQGMAKNENLPPLFREIYQNAFLPFNSSHVLTLFLKEIDKFSHGESDDIGDAYEYLLSITGSQGDVGQFRTPRHIIKFIVEAVNPTKDDKVLDPAVGTAGFLIAAYNHVKNAHDGKDENGNKNSEKYLSADELSKLHSNYRGFDIDPTMVRTASVNMYLHGFSTPDIINHDSLSSEEYWNDKYDVILANPPFMTPKGGIQPHKKFTVAANRAEVLFVDYIASHLKPNGRAGIVVPEGIIFQSGNAYKQLRKNLVENYLYAVVSLPAGVFQPYSGVKTSILLLDRELAKRNEILFVKVENDGFSSGAQRRPMPGNQLPEALERIDAFKCDTLAHDELAHTVLRSEIAESGDYNLSGDRYKIVKTHDHKDYPMTELGNLLEVFSGYAFKSSEFNENGTGLPVIRIRDIKPSKTKTFYSGEFEKKYLVENGDILIGMDGEFNINVWNGGRALLNQRVARLQNFKNVEKNYVYYLIKQKLKIIEDNTFAVTVKHISAKQIKEIKIPLPPIETQRQIVAELDSYQKIIDAAQIIVKSYKPTIKINPEWKIIKIGDYIKIERGASPRPIDQFMSSNLNDENWVMIGDTKNIVKYITSTAKRVTQDGALKSRKVEIGDFILSNSMSFGKPYIMKTTGYIHDGWLVLRTSEQNDIDQDYLYYILGTEYVQTQFELSATGGVVRNLNSDLVRRTNIPLPPLETQRQIVTELEAEQQLINANKKLIEIYQQKIKDKIAEVWGE
ncbi:N-6 DNA methylase [Candidatus Saccharibacteria bacterium HGW-Saccharibacteria-1]|jgi:type I restriction enzyme M protein|nr:MAG: N-6 DNA methylase [Candidatus Saccharibacteria bacterium HGW-Saccharibacteria-1]